MWQDTGKEVGTLPWRPEGLPMQGVAVRGGTAGGGGGCCGGYSAPAVENERCFDAGSLPPNVASVLREQQLQLQAYVMDWGRRQEVVLSSVWAATTQGCANAHQHADLVSLPFKGYARAHQREDPVSSPSKACSDANQMEEEVADAPLKTARMSCANSGTNEKKHARQSAVRASRRDSCENRAASALLVYITQEESKKETCCKMLITAMRSDLPEPTTRVARLVHSVWFDYFCAFFIVLNSVFIAVASDYAMGHLHDPETSWSRVVDASFCAFYTGELALRITAHSWRFFACKDWMWNWFDVILVISAHYDLVMSMMDLNSIKVNTMRLLRLTKMLKMFRIIRVMKAFRELRLIMRSLLSSVNSMFWSLVMLVFIMFLVGSLFLQGVIEHLQAGAASEEEKENILLYWGSMQGCVLTLYTASTGGVGWEEPAKILSGVGEHYYYIFVVYIAFFMFAVTNVITSLLVEATMNNAEIDTKRMMNDELTRKYVYIDFIKKLYSAMDEDNSGSLTYTEFATHLNSPQMHAFTSALDLELSDVASFFRLLAPDENSAVDLETFVIGCMKLRGAAKSMDLMGLIHEHKRSAAFTKAHIAKVEERLDAIDKRLSEVASQEARLSAIDNFFTAVPSQEAMAMPARAAAAAALAAAAPAAAALPGDAAADASKILAREHGRRRAND